MSWKRSALFLVVGAACASGCLSILGGDVDFTGQTTGTGGNGGATGTTTTGTTTTTSSTGTPTTTTTSTGTMPVACEGGPTCTTSTDCTTQSTECILNTCNEGCCGTSLAAAEAPCSDNGGLFCDGQGKCVACVMTGDCPVSKTVCATTACSSDKCVSTPAAKGITCTDNGGTVCDGAGACVAATCNNGVIDGSETDVDCGGNDTCGRCADGRMCAAGSDCLDKVCSGTPKTCQAPSCSDTVKNGTETGVDCGGGGCPACGSGQGCMASTDCQSGICSGQDICLAPTCSDGVKNGLETGIDCGGASTCARCPTGQGCKTGSDCLNGVCTGGTCAAPSCSDGVLNGTETDLDCGGATCDAQGALCAFGKACKAGPDCAGAFCVANKCDAQILASSQVGPWGIAVDSTNAYWTTFGGGSTGTVMQLALTTLVAVSPPLAMGQAGPTGIAIDSENVYWRNADDGTIRAERINGGVTMAPLVSGIGIGFNVAVNITNVFWSDDSGISKAPITGGTGTPLTTMRAEGIALDASHIYWTTDTSGTTMPTVESFSFTTGGLSTLVSGIDDSSGIAVDATNIYWGAQSGVYKTPVGSTTATLLSNAYAPAPVASDASFVYFITPGTMSSINKVAINGGTAATPLATGQAMSYGIAVDSTYVYWTNYGDGTVKRIHK